MAITFRTSCPVGVYTPLSTAGQSVRINSKNQTGKIVVATAQPAANVANYMSSRAQSSQLGGVIAVGALDIVYYQPLNADDVVDGLVGDASDLSGGLLTDL